METAEKQPTPQGAPKQQNKAIEVLQTAIIPIAAVVVALLIGAVIIAISGSNPIEAYKALVIGGLGTERAIGRTLEKATPLIFGGLAVSFAFKAGLFNIGAQGQLLMGALFAGYAGYAIEGLPALVHVPLALLIGAGVAALWGAIPGVLRAYTGAHEVIITIMLNYVAINLTDYFADGPWKDRSPGNVIARTPKILDSAEIPSLMSDGFLSRVPMGVVIAIIMAIIVWWIIERSTWGFALRTVGDNPNAAEYAGISVKRVIVIAMVASAFLAGMGGAVETLGVVGRFQPGFNAGLGFTAITIALLARTNPLGVIPAALLIGVMQAGSSQMQFNSGVSADIIEVVQALILFFVAADVLIRKMLFIRKPGQKLAVSGSGQ